MTRKGGQDFRALQSRARPARKTDYGKSSKETKQRETRCKLFAAVS